MKTVITSSDNKLDAEFDLRFGRAAWFCIIDDDKVDFLKNENAEANSGAGTKAAEQMVQMGVSKIISGDFGPKAKQLLDRFSIQMVILENSNRTIQDIIDLLEE